jgi:hypothetical protein
MNPSTTYSPLFQVFGRETPHTVESINHAAFQQMLTILQRPLQAYGLCTLLRAPRAGYGKSHLLCRLQQNLRGTHEFVLLQAAEGNRFDAVASLESLLMQLNHALPGGAGLTALDLLARKLFALGLEPLVRSGEVPSQDRESALLTLAQRPTETFDFHHPSAVTAHWARDHFEVMGPRLIVELSKCLQAPMRDITFWVEVLFRYAVTPLEHPGRLATLFSAVGASSPTAAHDRLSVLLHFLSQWQRIVLVVDELEGLSANPEAALRLATFLTSIRHSAERVDVILSVNDDVWESAFVPRLSGGLLDRLTEAFVRLTPLSEQEALSLLQGRHHGATMANLVQLQLKGDLYARAVLRAAALQEPLPFFASAPQPMPVEEPWPMRQSLSESPVASRGWWTENDLQRMDALAENGFADPEPYQLEPQAPTPDFAVPSPFSAIPLADIASDFQSIIDSAPTQQPVLMSAVNQGADNDRVNELLRQFRERYVTVSPPNT